MSLSDPSESLLPFWIVFVMHSAAAAPKNFLHSMFVGHLEIELEILLVFSFIIIKTNLCLKSWNFLFIKKYPWEFDESSHILK
jgi:hypothetical protein